MVATCHGVPRSLNVAMRLPSAEEKFAPHMKPGTIVATWAPQGRHLTLRSFMTNFPTD